jgi:hypothetical protein
MRLPMTVAGARDSFCILARLLLDEWMDFLFQRDRGVVHDAVR